MPVDPKLDLLPAFEDFGKWTDSLPETQKASVLKRFEFVPEEAREAEQKRWLSVGMISQRTGIDPGEVSQKFETHYMPRFSKDSEFGLGLSVLPKDASDFYNHAKKKLVFEKASNDASNEGLEMALDPNRPISSTVVPNGEKGPISIDRGLQAFNQWQSGDEAKGEHAAAFLKGWNKGLEKLSPYRDKINELQKLGASINDGEKMSQAMEGESALETSPFSKMARIMMEIPKDDRSLVLSVLAKKSASDKPGAGNRLFLELGRGFNELFSEGTDKLGQRALHYLGLGIDTPEYKDFMDLRDEVREVAYGGSAKIDPVKLLGADLSGVARNTPMTIGAFVPYLGPLAMTGQFQRDTANELRRDHPNMPRDVRERVADISAPFQALSEVVSDRLLLGRLPNLQRVFTLPAFTASSIAKQAVGRLALGTVTETVEELFQQATPKMVMDVLGALGQDMPDTDWGRFGTDFVKKTPELLSVIVPMVLLGGGVGSISDYTHGKDLARDVPSLVASGYSQASAEDIAAMARSGNWKGAEQAMRQEWSTINAQAAPMSAVASSATAKAEWLRTTQEAQELVSSHIKEGEEKLEEMVNSQMIPDIEIRDGKYVLTDRFDGSSATFNSWDEARQAATQHMNENERNQADLVAHMADSFMSGTPATLPAGESINIRQGSTSLADRVRSGELTAEDAMESAVAGGVIKGLSIPEARQIASAVFGESQEERTMAIRREVEAIHMLGSNVVKGGQSQSTVNLGGNERAFLTVVEEAVEGRWKAGLAAKHFDKAQGLSWVKLAEQATGEKFLEGATAEEIAASSEASPRALTEAISRIVTADVLGRLKDGKRIGPGSVSRGLNLADREQSALAAILHTFRQFFAAILNTAAKLSKARQEGKLGAEYDQLFDKLTGDGTRWEHERGTIEAAHSIAEGATGETFSIRKSPANLTEAEAHLRSLAGKEMTTADGLTASVSGRTASKMVSHSAVRKSASPEAHLAAIGSIEELFSRGHISESKPDRDNNEDIKAVHRVNSRMELDGKEYAVKFTVKELVQPSQGSRIYSIEAVDVDAPSAGQLTHSAAEAANRDIPHTDGTTDNPSAPGQSQETHSLRAGDFQARVDKVYSDFAKTPEQRLTLQQVARQRVQKEMAKLREIFDDLAAGEQKLAEGEIRHAEAVAKLREDLEADEAQIRQDRDFELKGVTEDKGSELDRERIRREADNELKKRRIQFERELAAVNERLASGELKGSNTGAGIDRQKIKAIMRVMEAAVSTLPMEIRGKIGNFSQVAAMTDEKALEVVEAKIRKADAEFEKHLKKELSAQVDKLLEKHRSTRNKKGVLEGRTVASVTEQINYAADFKELSKADQEKELRNLEGIIADDKSTSDAIDAAIVSAGVAELFYDFDNLDAEALSTVSNWLNGLVASGRDLKKALDADRREWLSGVKTSSITSVLGRPDASKIDADNAMEKIKGSILRSALERVKGFIHSTLPTVAQQFEDIFGVGSEVGSEFIPRIWAAANRSTDIKRRIEAARKAMLANVFKTDSTIEQINALAKLQQSKKSGVFIIEGRKTETVKVPLEILERLADGGISAKDAGLSQAEVKEALDQWAKASDRTRNATIERETFAGSLKELEMSEMQALNYWLHWNQDAVRARMEKHGWTEESITQMQAFMSDETKAIGRWMSETYATTGRQLVDPVYRRLYHAPLPAVKNFAPTFYDVGGNDNTLALDQQQNSSGIMASFTKGRRDHNQNVRRVDAMTAFLSHFEHVSHWVSYVEVLRDMKAVVASEDVQHAIITQFGPSAASSFVKRVKAIETQGNNQAWSLHEMDGWAKQLNQARAFKALAWRISPVVKQTSAMLNPLLADVPAHAYAIGLAKLTSGNLDVSGMWKSDSIRRRIEGGFSAEARLAMEAGGNGPIGATAIHIMQKGMMPMQYTDAAWSTAGAAIAYDYYRGLALKAGENAEMAERSAARAVDGMLATAAQPADQVNRSLVEGSPSPYVKAIWMFASESRKTLAIEYYAAKRLLTGTSKHKAMDVQRVLVAHVVMAATTQLMSGILASLIGSDDDSDREWSASEWAAALIAGPINGLFVVGDALNMVVRRALDLSVFSSKPGLIKVAEDAVSAATHIDDLFDGDSEKMLAEINRLSGSIGNILSSLFGPAAQSADVVLGNPLRDLGKIIRNVVD